MKEVPSIPPKKRVLFICMHNSARSQMAEGYLRARCGGLIEVFSAGTEPASVHPMAIEVMQEIGIDISSHRSKHVKEFMGREMDLAVTICDTAQGVCTMFPWAKETIHAEFPDPAAVRGSEDEVRTAFRQVRDSLITWIMDRFPECLEEDR